MDKTFRKAAESKEKKSAGKAGEKHGIKDSPEKPRKARQKRICGEFGEKYGIQASPGKLLKKTSAEKTGFSADVSLLYFMLSLG